MERNRAQSIGKKCFSVLILITVLLLLALPTVVWMIETSDSDGFLDGMLAAMTALMLLMLLIHEIVFYNTLHYYLGDRETKRPWKSFLFGVLFLGNMALLSMETAYLINYI